MDQKRRRKKTRVKGVMVNHKLGEREKGSKCREEEEGEEGED